MGPAIPLKNPSTISQRLQKRPVAILPRANGFTRVIKAPVIDARRRTPRGPIPGSARRAPMLRAER